MLSRQKEGIQLKKAFLCLLLFGTFTLAACGTPGSLNASSKTSSVTPSTVSQSANSVSTSSASSSHSAGTTSKVETNISAKGVNSKVSKQTVSSAQSKVNEITSLDNELSQGEQDVSINTN